VTEKRWPAPVWIVRDEVADIAPMAIGDVGVGTPVATVVAHLFTIREAATGLAGGVR